MICNIRHYYMMQDPRHFEPGQINIIYVCIHIYTKYMNTYIYIYVYIYISTNMDQVPLFGGSPFLLFVMQGMSVFKQRRCLPAK